MDPEGSARAVYIPMATYNVLVPKASGGYRLTTDFRKLNSLTEADTFPLADMKAVLDWTPPGLYQYTRMPQGLKNSPATLQRVINATLGDLKGRPAFAYMDDLTVGSEDAWGHLRDLREVFKDFGKEASS
ncbi:hypothetical protein NDN08_004349 [Rhodosorus marinus]|uniref:Reverse transcriptase domain-containing protein n=1 Tax=Rhodosorus marinus TaxID=101924 RepID=A0AAV8ULF8_9RHOD|nr:hypothetical protein NDN08_004349 [Rhodosorus marinus]